MRAGRLGVALIAVLAVAACTPQGDADPVPTPTATRTVVTKAAVPLPELPHHAVAPPLPRVRVSGSVIHVGSHSYDVSPLRADSAVSTRGGVYFLNAGELWSLDEPRAMGTGFTKVTRLVVSPNGRYLGFVDRNHGPATGPDAQVATAVVYDTTAGSVVVHSRKGMAGDDLRTSYRAHPPQAIGFEGGALVASTPSGTYAYPLSGAAPHPSS